jgi:hypothetical protein
MNRRALGIIVAAAALLVFPAAALADNCSSAGDCWGTGAAAAAAAAGAGAAAGAAAAGRGQNGSGRGKGFVYYWPLHSKGFATTSTGGMQSFPGAGDRVGSPPIGSRMVFDDVLEVDDHTWYHVRRPGGESGWIPKYDTWPTRPVMPSPPAPRIIRKEAEWYDNLRPTAAQTTSARG